MSLDGFGVFINRCLNIFYLLIDCSYFRPDKFLGGATLARDKDDKSGDGENEIFDVFSFLLSLLKRNLNYQI